ncbi:MAG TPA: FkbM family methyltransferase [Steroidobacteraceae bacterium]|nr:FkbM family methyltransferase [Steroidobacteraceae bacterium]
MPTLARSLLKRSRRLVRKGIERSLHVQLVPEGEAARIFEREHLRRFFRHFQVDCVFDVGANVGQYATMLRAHVGYRGHIISYEPIPQTAAKLRAAAAGDRAWHVEELALDRASGFATFNCYDADEMSSFHALSPLGEAQFENERKQVRAVRVRTATLADELARYAPKLGFQRPYLKMDTQGHDLAVAAGAGERLREFVGLQSELAIRRLYAESPRYEEAIRFYEEFGFELSALVPNNLGFFPRLLEMDCIMFRAPQLPQKSEPIAALR